MAENSRVSETQTQPKGRAGIWLIGGRGQIATVVAIGLLSLQKGLCSKSGLVTELPLFGGLPLRAWPDFTLGGADIRKQSIVAQAESLCWSTREIDPHILESVKPGLQELDNRIGPGTAINCGDAITAFADKDLQGKDLSLRETIEKIRQSITAFAEQHELDRVIVINVASTEPSAPPELLKLDGDGLERVIDNDEFAVVRAGTIYSYAAIQENCPYINFTPSPAALPQAIIKLAEERQVPVMGNDGKTGETLVKSALAPMFAMRNLKVLSWEGFNILGNRDGQVLRDPVHKESKIRTKNSILPNILGYDLHSTVHIDYVPSLDDQKTAWDFIHFQGFLGTKMSLQFIWQGYDSILAAPLILDLARMADLAAARRESGVMDHLACFFKQPLGSRAHSLSDQFAELLRYSHCSPTS